ncbi:MAG: hypothetical protein QQN63_13685 [Nitrosopumilus sp.]
MIQWILNTPEEYNMILGEFRKLTKNISDESEIVIWCYFDIYDEYRSVIKDAQEGCTNFHLNINDWQGIKKALHFTMDAQQVYNDMNARIN